MGTFHATFEKVINGLISNQQLLREAVRKVIETKGVTLPENVYDDVTEQILSVGTKEDPLTFQLDDLDHDIKIEICGHELTAAMSSLDGELVDRLNHVIVDTVKQFSPQFLNSLRENLPSQLEHNKASQADFEQVLYSRWKEGLDLLNMLVLLAKETGSNLLEDVKSEEEPCNEEEAEMHWVLFSLHARACRIASEVVCLLHGGFADGANARWRSLHEVAVVATFLSQYGPEVAQRYHDHSAIEQLKGAEVYQLHCNALGHEPISDSNLAALRLAADEAIAKYGDTFRSDYGWASKALNLKRPTFVEVEDALQLAPWRPVYKLACQSVHAGSDALKFSLADPDAEDLVMLAGSSDAGLADPAISTAMSLTMASAAVLSVQPNLDSLIGCQCLQLLTEEIQATFLELERQYDSIEE